VIGTPIGNPRDLSPRALEVLGKVALVACEDTRRAGRMLAGYGVDRPLVSFYEHNEERRTRELVARLKAGADVALVTDAGTPAISDPGFRLVRAAVDVGARVVAIPGPSALTAALSIAGLPTDRFVFEGFLPAQAAARRNVFAGLQREKRTIVFFEPARRLGETMAEMAAIFGADREAAIVREMTKTFEETVRGTLGALAGRYAKETARGEVTIVVAGAAEQRPSAGGEVCVALDDLCAAGLSLKDATALMARLTGASRREIYQKAIRDRTERGAE
jgi:16S rRNA (cytidine1402-2'-O)-methyltransferase